MLGSGDRSTIELVTRAWRDEDCVLSDTIRSSPRSPELLLLLEMPGRVPMRNVLFIVIIAGDERGDMLSSLHAIFSGDVYMHITKVSHYSICDKLICATKLAPGR